MNFTNSLKLFCLTITLCTTAFANTKPAENTVIRQLVTQHHFNRTYLKKLFSALTPDQKIIAAMTQPFEKEPWSYYRNFFLTPKRIALGADYLKKHHRVLMEMQHQYGIPASMIAAIIGVETEYGRHFGKYSVLRSLYTLGFYYPPRETFFRKEFMQYLILTRDNHLNAQTIKGSYAGALGIPQFMPSSYRHYGVAYRKGDLVNLFENNDAIASVANYFHQNGWRANQPIARPLPSYHTKINPRTEKRLTLRVKSGMQYWVLYHNFNVIMSYNHNIVYAMAVYQLSQAIQKQYAHDAK